MGSSLAILRTEADHPPPDSRDETVDLDAKFSPNLLNSAIFLLSTSQQVSTFAVNFIGRPFREDISENTFLKYGLLGASGVAVAGAIDFAPEFSKWLQIVEMSVRACFFLCSSLVRWTDTIWFSQWDFRTRLCAAMFIDFVGAWVIDKVLKAIFQSDKPKDLITRGSERREARREAEKREAELAEVVKKDE